MTQHVQARIIDQPCLAAGAAGHSRVVGIEWYNGSGGHAEPNCPVLAICLDNGRMQLMRHDMDDSAVCVDTGIRPSGIKWNHNGSVSSTGSRRRHLRRTTAGCWWVQL